MSRALRYWYSRAAAAAAAAGMHVLAAPARMVLVRVEPPAQHEMRAALVALLLRPHRLADRFGQLAVGLMAALVAGVDVPGVGLHARQRRASFALRGLARALLQLGAGHLGVDFRHCRSPCCCRVLEIFTSRQRPTCLRCSPV